MKETQQWHPIAKREKKGFPFILFSACRSNHRAITGELVSHGAAAGKLLEWNNSELDGPASTTATLEVNMWSSSFKLVCLIHFYCGYYSVFIPAHIASLFSLSLLFLPFFKRLTIKNACVSTERSNTLPNLSSRGGYIYICMYTLVFDRKKKKRGERRRRRRREQPSYLTARLCASTPFPDSNKLSDKESKGSGPEAQDG